MGKPDEYSVGQSGEILVMINVTKAIANAHYPIPTAPVEEWPSKTSYKSRESDTSSNHTLSRLLEIPIPKFHGYFHLWQTLRNRFTALVDVRSGFLNINKFYYLMDCLQGTTFNGIHCIPASDENYKFARLLLSACFCRPRMVTTLLINKLISWWTHWYRFKSLFTIQPHSWPCLMRIFRYCPRWTFQTLAHLYCLRWLFEPCSLAPGSRLSPLSRTTLIILLLVIW